MDKTYRKIEDIILQSLEQHQADLHLLFVNDISTMDLTFYNEITLALSKAQIDINTAKENYEARMQNQPEPWPEDTPFPGPGPTRKCKVT